MDRSETMKRSQFRENIVSVVDDALDQGLSQDTVEAVLQQQVQQVRENRRVYNVFVYECSNTNCEESATQTVDQMDLQCDICEQTLRLFESTYVGDAERMEFRCEDHDTVRVHDFSAGEITCSIHNERMNLLKSYSTDEGLGN